MKITEELYKPFEDIRSRKGRGGVYDYINWKDVADRMNQVFGYRWSSNVVSQEVIDGNVIVRINVCIKDTENDDVFCQDGYGGAPLREGEEAGTAHKSAYSKALKDACRKWGVGLRFDDDQDGNTQTPGGYSGKEYGIPGGNVSQPSPPSNAQSNAGYPPVVNHNTNTPSAPTPSAPTPSAPTPSAPTPSAPTPSAPTPSASTGTQSLPSVPSPGGSQSTPVDTSDAEKLPSDPGTITSVQEMAIKNLSKLKGHADGNVEAFIKNMIDSGECGVTKICPLNQYSYNEAVDIIKTAKKLQ